MGKAKTKIIKGIEHEIVPGGKVPVSKSSKWKKLKEWHEEEGGTKHPLGTVFSDGKHGYVASGNDWLKFDIESLSKFKPTKRDVTQKLTKTKKEPVKDNPVFLGFDHDILKWIAYGEGEKDKQPEAPIVIEILVDDKAYENRLVTAGNYKNYKVESPVKPVKEAKKVEKVNIRTQENGFGIYEDNHCIESGFPTYEAAEEQAITKGYEVIDTPESAKRPAKESPVPTEKFKLIPWKKGSAADPSGFEMDRIIDVEGSQDKAVMMAEELLKADVTVVKVEIQKVEEDPDKAKKVGTVTSAGYEKHEDGGPLDPARKEQILKEYAAGGLITSKDEGLSEYFPLL